jgi:hypothetical protein
VHIFLLAWIDQNTTLCKQPVIKQTHKTLMIFRLISATHLVGLATAQVIQSTPEILPIIFLNIGGTRPE